MGKSRAHEGADASCSCLHVNRGRNLRPAKGATRGAKTCSYCGGAHKASSCQQLGQDWLRACKGKNAKQKIIKMLQGQETVQLGAVLGQANQRVRTSRSKRPRRSAREKLRRLKNERKRLMRDRREDRVGVRLQTCFKCCNCVPISCGSSALGAGASKKKKTQCSA